MHCCFSFNYLMNLHYSQTQKSHRWDTCLFNYLMNLHYSQTSSIASAQPSQFNYLMNLHYSQTVPLAGNIIISLTTL